MPEKVAAQCHALFQELWEEMVELMPDTLSTLRQLKERGLVLALATSSRRLTVDLFIHKFKLENIFTVTISTDDVRTRKHGSDCWQSWLLLR
ncbi:MAG: hypothetical protein COT71_01395 [Candidatus Andersenbacteria bacterium CG10_big_fil_rev_8_21_14_0_10_54_11]|uniref:HAD family hydrolase n=1 Tax=Candidatus Andersenbacteria bacterium CG10_big_fil_rev_8_21_14_0_10_54_11 TaxID=1974485 RepID=A0A2M6WZX0_9BACT|nr:MAG: hypothetical protein COT71_01395 [Candidatus Andersenbacteria bacterium CG10_big_fil_rev_8_21_14_0_10_54_11]